MEKRQVIDRKIGVYVCECGPNIADAMDIDRIIEAVSGMENVTVVERYVFPETA
jgi:heterodisulfide reductase subunit A